MAEISANLHPADLRFAALQRGTRAAAIAAETPADGSGLRTCRFCDGGAFMLAALARHIEEVHGESLGDVATPAAPAASAPIAAPASGGEAQDWVTWEELMRRALLIAERWEGSEGRWRCPYCAVNLGGKALMAQHVIAFHRDRLLDATAAAAMPEKPAEGGRWGAMVIGPGKAVAAGPGGGDGTEALQDPQRANALEMARRSFDGPEVYRCAHCRETMTRPGALARHLLARHRAEVVKTEGREG